jgi:hypothetical protein
VIELPFSFLSPYVCLSVHQLSAIATPVQVFCLRHDKGEEEEEVVCRSEMVGETVLNEKQNTLREIT